MANEGHYLSTISFTSFVINCIGIICTSHKEYYHCFERRGKKSWLTLLSFIFSSDSYYPLYPPYLKEDTVTKATSTMETTGSYIENLPEVNLDVALAYGDSETAGHANLNVLPDLLVLPSKLKPFVKVKEEGEREG